MKCTIIVLFFFMYSSFAYSENKLLMDSPQSFRFERISVEAGLSQSTVNTIIQDKEGFIWFGTEDGLNRYDGYNFLVYKHNPENRTSISNNFIWSLCEDSDGNIWIGTDGGGACKLNTKTEIFTHFVNI